jgi:translation initiation factor 2 beta subunit (eIF-2beta)/eIF-5
MTSMLICQKCQSVDFELHKDLRTLTCLKCGQKYKVVPNGKVQAIIVEAKNSRSE